MRSTGLNLADAISAIESQTPDGEAKRDDEHFSYSAAWEWKGEGQPPVMHQEPLTFEHVHLTQRSYK